MTLNLKWDELEIKKSTKNETIKLDENIIKSLKTKLNFEKVMGI
jgi:hypothetical protein